MKKFIGTIVGEFTKRQEVKANNLEEAKDMLLGNTGDDIEESLTGQVELLDIEEIEE